MDSPNINKRYLKIEEKGLQLDTFEQIAPILHQISESDHLEHLKFSGNTLGVDSAKHLAKALANLKRLKVLDMSDIFTGRSKQEIPVALKYITESLLTLPNLTTVDFSHNAFGPHGAQPLTEFLKNSESLQSLHLTNNGLGETGGLMIFEALAERAKIQSKATIKSLNVGRNRLDSDKIIEIVSKTIELHKDTLVCLRLPQNGIRANSIKLLIQSVVKCTNLEELDLQDNTFSLEASELLRIDSLNKLKILNLGECLIKNKPFKKIVSSIKEPTKIEELNLTYNELSANSISELIKVLDKFKHLKRLELNGNSFAEDNKIIFKLQEELAKHNNYCELGSLSDMEVDSELDNDLSDVGEDEDEVSRLTGNLEKLSTK